MIPVVLDVRIIEMLASRHPGPPLAAAPLVGSAGDCVTADVPARPVDDREMRGIAFGFQYCARLGTDLYRFTSAIHMVIVIGGFDERSG